MRILVSAPGNDLKESDVDGIQRDLEKIDRRLANFKEEVTAEVRISENRGGTAAYQVVIELDYGRNHIVAKTTNSDMGTAVREARDDLIRQINDRSRGGHSSFAKGR